jgi:hypothetical protein
VIVGDADNERRQADHEKEENELAHIALQCLRQTCGGGLAKRKRMA